MTFRGLCSSRAIPQIACLAALLAVSPVAAHEAPKGWTYPFACCSDYDCRAVPVRSVREGPEGYVIDVTGEVLSYGDKRVRNSPDGDFHWCSVAGKNDGRTICLFVPPRAY